MEDKKIGHILWHDLTVNDAAGVSEFYNAVIGWEKEGLSMGDYDDFVIKNPGEDDAVAGICHARGVNKDIPPQWLMYVQVADLDKSIARCKEFGGKIIGEKRKMGEGFYCLIQDPAGAHVMLCG